MSINKELYTKILDSVPIITVDIVIFNPEKDKVLLFKRENKPLQNTYYTPGGRVNKNEKLIDAIIRKAKEEIGINIKSKEIKYCGIIEEFFDDSNFKEVLTGTHNINIFYKYIINDITNIKLDNQHQKFDWFNINDPNLNIYIKKKINISSNI